jgi:hypothetical protein
MATKSDCCGSSVSYNNDGKLVCDECGKEQGR